jgi:uncharacterized tellurite resistance protein B-like protein
MSISDLYSSGFRERNQDHFAAIVRVAMSNDVISEDEKAFLDRMAKNLDISESNYKEILKDYKSHPINPPTMYNERLDRLFDLSRMVYADHQLGPKQTAILERLGIGLGFSPENVPYVVHKALLLVSKGVGSEDFKDEIKNMNR